jgi:rRNA maturation protein Nop10
LFHLCAPEFGDRDDVMASVRQRMPDFHDVSQTEIRRFIDQDANPHRLRDIGVRQDNQALAARPLSHQQPLAFEQAQRGRDGLAVDPEMLGEPRSSRQFRPPASPQHFAAQMRRHLLRDGEKARCGHTGESSPQGCGGQAKVSPPARVSPASRCGITPKGRDFRRFRQKTNLASNGIGIDQGIS